MDASQFTLWLQGFAELNTAPPTPEQWKSIREHLQLVFTKVTPQLGVFPPIDLKDSAVIKELLEKALKERAPIWPSTPTYWQDQPSTGKPGIIAC